MFVDSHNNSVLNEWIVIWRLFTKILHLYEMCTTFGCEPQLNLLLKSKLGLGRMILLTHSLHDCKLYTYSEKPCLTHDMVFCTVRRRKQKNHILKSLEMKQMKKVLFVDCEDIKIYIL